MVATVVCISRAMYTGAENIAHEVAQELGFRYVDEEIVERAAQKRGLQAAEVASAERRKNFLVQALEEIADQGSDLVAYFANNKEATRPSDELRNLIRQAIQETADEGRVVIVAHAASYALARRKQVLRVLITGSEFGRVMKWAPTAGGASPTEAGEAIRASDAARADYLRRFYDVKQESPSDYDLTVSVDSLKPASIRELVLQAARLVD
ncbi:cytidylate kinase-like family protein [Ramlibacter sp. PS4R-6]|uniref:cytidylate kinase-like family protein n=1 Tax=Ramlibacter sp. PS4R-6 TaxID=3133438 RepID=UPI00309C6F6F